MINFAPWAPDIARFNTEMAAEALNVIPCSTGYTPFRSLTATQFAASGYVPAETVDVYAIPGTALGGYSANIAGTIVTFIGNATSLYRLTTDGVGWVNVTRTTGGAYATPQGNNWRFATFGDYIIAVNGQAVPQKFRVNVDTKFSNLTGAPVATDIAVVGDFLVLQTADNKLAWSGVNDLTDWSLNGGATMSDTQTFPDGGQFIGITGGRDGLIYHETCIRRMTFEGPPRIFRFDKISENVGCKSRGSIAVFENTSFFLSNQGFRQLSAAGSLDPIGSEKVDNWFSAVLDETQMSLVSSAIDPVRKLYIVGFADAATTSPNNMLFYHWPTGKWSRANQAHQFVFSGIPQGGYTIDGLDALSDTVEGLEIPVDSSFYLGSDFRALVGVTTGGKIGLFAGVTAEAVIETGDAQLVQGRKTMLRGLRPMVEGTSVIPELTILYRDRLQDAPAVTAAPVPANVTGFCPVRVNARYHRARVKIPAGSEWSFATGIDDLKLSAMGTR